MARDGEVVIRYRVPRTKVCLLDFKRPWWREKSKNSPLKKLTHPFRKQTTIVVRLGVAIDRLLLLNSLYAIETALIRVIDRFGDIVIVLDTYTYQTPQGAIMNVRQRNRRLTYGMILNVTRGLLAVLIGRQNYFEANFIILQAKYGRIGAGTIKRAPA